MRRLLAEDSHPRPALEVQAPRSARSSPAGRRLRDAGTNVLIGGGLVGVVALAIALIVVLSGAEAVAAT